jgi:hypothetical protein
MSVARTTQHAVLNHAMFSKLYPGTINTSEFALLLATCNRYLQILANNYLQYIRQECANMHSWDLMAPIFLRTEI